MNKWKIAKELVYLAKAIKAYKVDYKYSPAQYDGNAFIVLSLFSVKMLKPADAVSLINEVVKDMKTFATKNKFKITEQRLQRFQNKDCLVTIIDSQTNNVESCLKNQLGADVFYHVRFDN